MAGVILYLTKRHGGNVHAKGIVTITSNSVLAADCGPANVADLNPSSYFCSKDAPGEWICWDFHEMRLHPTHYRIQSRQIKSWVVEGSVDGANWTEIDRKTDTEDFKSRTGPPSMSSFPVSNPAESRFIRLTQTDRRHSNDNELWLGAVEFFGTLYE
jgi:hypothetical protein